MKKVVNIILGNVMIAFAISTLVLQHNIIAGGVSGIGSVIEHYLHLPISLTVGIINIVLFLMGLLFIGKEFAMKTLLSTFLFPALLDFFNQQTMFHNLLSDTFLSSVLGGVIIGYGVGLILKSGGSTGGFDIVALLIESYCHVPVSLTFNLIDITILLLQCLFHNFDQVIYGIVTVMLTAYIMNHTLMSGKALAQIVIMSDQYQQIQQVILEKINAGVTMLHGTKGYTDQDTKVVLSVIPYRKLPMMKEMIKEVDDKAFVIVSKIEEVGGNGFTRDLRDNFG